MHNLKLYKGRFLTDVGKYSFTNRIIDEWNLLSENVVSCNSVDSFKIKLDRYFKSCRGFIAYKSMAFFPHCPSSFGLVAYVKL